MMIAMGSISFTISANASNGYTEKQASSAKTTADSKAKYKKLSGEQLFSKAAEAYEKAMNDDAYQVAYEYALAGAKKNNKDAQLLLSLLYEMGNGVEMDVEVAEEWRTKAAKNGSMDAKGVIAIMGIAQDLDQENVKKFKPYAEEAYKAGSIFGLAAMAFVLHDGYGGQEPKPLEGEAMLRKAMTKPADQLNFFERIYLSDIQELSLEIE